MQCPACANGLSDQKVAELNLKVCDGGCGGIWLPGPIVGQLAQEHDFEGEALLELQPADASHTELNAARQCPVCSSAPLSPRYRNAERNVALDACAECGGHWLSDNEIGRLQGAFETEEEKRDAVQNHFEALLGDQVRALKNGADRDATLRVARIIRLMCPSYYLPAEEEWDVL